MGDAAIACPDIADLVNLQIPSDGVGSQFFCYHFHAHPESMNTLAASYGVPACNGFYVVDLLTPGMVHLCEWSATATGLKCRSGQARHCVEVRVDIPTVLCSSVLLLSSVAARL